MLWTRIVYETCHLLVSDAKGQLTELVRCAEGGEEIVLTRHGLPVVRLAPVTPKLGTASRRDTIARVRAMAARKDTAGPGAARSQDFLYGNDGLPE